MASRFQTFSEEEIWAMNEAVVHNKYTKMHLKNHGMALNISSGAPERISTTQKSQW